MKSEQEFEYWFEEATGKPALSLSDSLCLRAD